MISKEDKEILELIEQLAEMRLPQQTPTTLFDALGFVKLEAPHSKFIAWLLTPGILNEGWLLQKIISKKFPHIKDIGPLSRIEREDSSTGKRPDIVIYWETEKRYRLIIENKVKAKENKSEETGEPEQVNMYLKEYDINTLDDGCLIYLNKDGDWPTSVKERKERVEPLSYKELADLLDEGIKEGLENENSKAKKFVGDYIETIRYKLFNLPNPNMKKPEIDGIPKALFNSDKISKINQWIERVDDKKVEVNKWIKLEIVKDFRKELNSEFEFDEEYELLKKKNWSYKNYFIGITYNNDVIKDNEVGFIGLHGCDKSKRLIPPEYAKEIVDYIFKKLKSNDKSKYLNRYDKNGKYWLLEKKGLEPFNIDNWENWVEKMRIEMIEMTKTLSPIIDEFVKSKKK